MSDNKNNNISKSGIGFCSLLTIAFIVLKLTKVINWSWIWVLAPLWITFALNVIISIFYIIVIYICNKKTSEKVNKKLKELKNDRQ